MGWAKRFGRDFGVAGCVLVTLVVVWVMSDTVRSRIDEDAAVLLILAISIAAGVIHAVWSRRQDGGDATAG